MKTRRQRAQPPHSPTTTQRDEFSRIPGTIVQQLYNGTVPFGMSTLSNLVSLLVQDVPVHVTSCTDVVYNMYPGTRTAVQSCTAELVGLVN